MRFKSVMPPPAASAEVDANDSRSNVMVFESILFPCDFLFEQTKRPIITLTRHAIKSQGKKRTKAFIIAPLTIRLIIKI
jgi:hypothetical protein